MINFFSDDDLKSLLNVMTSLRGDAKTPIMPIEVVQSVVDGAATSDSVIAESPNPIDDRPAEEQKKDEDDSELYSIKNFSL